MSKYEPCPHCGQDLRLSPGAVDELGVYKAEAQRWREMAERLAKSIDDYLCAEGYANWQELDRMSKARDAYEQMVASLPKEGK